MLGCVGLLRHLLLAYYLLLIWLVFVVLPAFAAAWIVFSAWRGKEWSILSSPVPAILGLCFPINRCSIMPKQRAEGSVVIWAVTFV